MGRGLRRSRRRHRAARPAAPPRCRRSDRRLQLSHAPARQSGARTRQIELASPSTAGAKATRSATIKRSSPINPMADHRSKTSTANPGILTVHFCGNFGAHWHLGAEPAVARGKGLVLPWRKLMCRPSGIMGRSGSGSSSGCRTSVPLRRSGYALPPSIIPRQVLILIEARCLSCLRATLQGGLCDNKVDRSAV